MIIDEKSSGGIRHFKEATQEEIVTLTSEQGRPEDITDEWNGYPGSQYLFDNLGDIPNVTYHGYVVDKERSDWRVSVEGFRAHGLTADHVLALVSIFDSADEKDHTKQEDGTYSVYFWWD